MREDDVIDLGEPDFFDRNERPGFTSSSGYPIRREIIKMHNNMTIIVKQMNKLKKQISKLEKKLNG
tara:strand:- start:7055 stop:7252 length:198 start_codon:yes stop_codon:yes gene_type:complete